MFINTLTVMNPDYPNILRGQSGAPQTLYHMGAPLNELLLRPAVTIVGSRKMSPYGEAVTHQFSRALAEQGIVIISGLAMGVDACAHRAALESGGLCIAVLPGPLDRILPARHWRLAQEILDKGGALVSEYAPGEIAYKQNFIARNRIMSGLSKVLLVTEAAEFSGTRHTVRFAFDQGKTVLAVPGDIDKDSYTGSNKFIKTDHAQLVTDPDDVIHALGLVPHKIKAIHPKGGNANEQKLLDLLVRGMSDGDELLEASGLEVSRFNQAITMLEINGKIRALGGNNWSLY